jgi:hypothetical protein
LLLLLLFFGRIAGLTSPGLFFFFFIIIIIIMICAVHVVLFVPAVVDDLSGQLFDFVGRVLPPHESSSLPVDIVAPSSTSGHSHWWGDSRFARFLPRRDAHLPYSTYRVEYDNQ